MRRGSSVGPKKDGVFNSAVHVVTGKVCAWEDGESVSSSGIDSDQNPIYHPHFDWGPYY